jgi:hypothetical protein
MRYSNNPVSNQSSLKLTQYLASFWSVFIAE